MLFFQIIRLLFISFPFHYVKILERIWKAIITDRIIALVNPETNQFALLCIDYVEGKYLIPEEWYRITSYKYGKKRSLANL